MKFKLVVLSIVLTTINFDQVWAQSDKIVEGSVNTWFLLLNRLNLSEKWSVTNEFHERTGKFLDDQGQFIWRPSLDYHWGQQVELSFGYSYLRTNSYEPYLLPLSRNENNIWWQFILKNQIGKVSVQYRFREENRWIDRFVSESGESAIDGVTYQNRFRYRLTASIDFFKTKGQQAVFLNVFDELWVNQNKRLMFYRLCQELGVFWLRL